MNVLAFATVTPVDEATAVAAAESLTGSVAPAHLELGAKSTAWVIAETGPALVTGRRDPGQAWQLSTPVELATLTTARLFDDDEELVLRRCPAGWVGLRLTDAPHPAPADAVDRPRTRRLIVDGTSDPTASHGSSAIRGADGRRFTIPIAHQRPSLEGAGTVLVVRDYLSSDDETGQLRIAATRCVRFDQGWGSIP